PGFFLRRLIFCVRLGADELVFRIPTLPLACVRSLLPSSRTQWGICLLLMVSIFDNQPTLESHMSAISRRAFLRNGAGQAVTAGFLAGLGTLKLRANPLGLPIG